MSVMADVVAADGVFGAVVLSFVLDGRVVRGETGYCGRVRDASIQS
jgi:hypothetical protein